MKKYFSKETEETFYDEETGRPSKMTKTKEFVHEIDKEEFMCTYFEYVKWLFNINSLLQAQILSYMAYRADFNTGVFDLSSSERESLMRELKTDTTSISRAVRKLLESDVIRKQKYTDEDGVVKEEKTKYMINPMLFWKGDMKTRKKLVVTFTSISDDILGAGPDEVNDALSQE